MKTFEVHFLVDGRAFVDTITTMDGFKARELIRGRYPGAKITSVRLTG